MTRTPQDKDLRYEFRVFGHDAIRMSHHLEKLAADAEPERRRDHYFLVRGRSDLGLKFRDGQLELKVLVRKRGRLELWHPAEKASLPLGGEELNDRFLTLAGLAVPNGEQVRDRQTLVSVLTGLHEIRHLGLAKSRRQFSIGKDLGEMTVIRVPGCLEEHSCAIEGTEPERLADLVNALGCAECTNVSYARRLLDLAFPCS